MSGRVRRWGLVALMVGLAGCAARATVAPVRLIEAGKAVYEIVPADNPTPAERYAVEELQKYVEEGARVKLPLAEPGRMPRRAIFVGRSAALDRAMPGIPWETLGSEGFVMRTSGGHLALAGGRPRGTLYAVYTFLDERLGCRWLTPDCTLVPKCDSLSLPEMNEVRRPKLEYRETFTFHAFDGDWAAHNRNNGNAARLTEKHGGKIVYTGFVHTFYKFLPPAKYFKDHPDWYSERNGTRFFERGQLCLTNPEVVKAMTEAVRAELKAHPETDIISVSQNDCAGWCECANCRRVDDEEGSHSGTLIRFVNQVAENLEKEFPHVAFDTLAYQYTRKPPLKVVPRPNVIVRLCSIECCFSHTLDECPENKTFRDDIIAWSRICDRLYVWDYVTNFPHYLLPHPNLAVLGPNIRFFVAHGVKGIFEEGAYQSFGSEMAELRAYMTARLLWDPDYDPDQLLDEFVKNYYGPAADAIREYIRLLHDQVRAESIHMRCFNQPSFAALTPEVIATADALFDEAEKRVADDPTLLRRVRTARLPVMYTQLVRGRAWARAAARAGVKTPVDEKALADKFFAVAADAKVTMIKEGGKFEPFKQAVLARLNVPRHTPTPPPGTEGMPPGKVIDAQDDEFSLYREGEVTRLTPAEGASDGMAAWMTGATKEWAIQWPVDVKACKAGKRYDAYVVLKIVKKGNEGGAFQAGIYDVEKRRSLGAISPRAADVTDGWRRYRIGAFRPEGRQYLWAAGCENGANIADILVDRFYLVESASKDKTEDPGDQDLKN